MKYSARALLLVSCVGLSACQIPHPSCDPYQEAKQFTLLTLATREAAKKSTPCVPQATPPVYCYRVQSDTLCYREPRKGWEGRMVGRQPVTRYEMNSKEISADAMADQAIRDAASMQLPSAASAAVSAAPLPPVARGGAASEAAQTYVPSPFPVAGSATPSYGNSPGFGGSSAVGGSAKRLGASSANAPIVLMPNP